MTADTRSFRAGRELGARFQATRSPAARNSAAHSSAIHHSAGTSPTLPAGPSLADLLPPLPADPWEWQPVVQGLCRQIPLRVMHRPGMNLQHFTEALYRLLATCELPDPLHGEVLEFFRGFAAAMVFPADAPGPSPDPAPSPDVPADLEVSSPLAEQLAEELSRSLAARTHHQPDQSGRVVGRPKVNINDLLEVLQLAQRCGQLQELLPPELTGYDSSVIHAALVQIIEAMTLEERLGPDLLLHHYDAARRYKRRRRIASSTGLSQEFVDHAMALFAEWRRSYQQVLQRASGA